jgi:acetylornithine/succinyldiaminopimelate/putrescine aminotransferase
VQGSNGCGSASPAFYAELLATCRRYGTLCLFDEYLTGLYRTGPRFFCEGVKVQPDMLVFGKSMANGFPCGALALRRDIAVAPAALPGSTFAGNPLAAAATAATIAAMQALPMAALVARIGAIVEDSFAPCVEAGFRLRGGGALWALEPASGALLAPLPSLSVLLERIAAAGVVISPAAGAIRLLPSATIDPALLADACQRIAAICLDPHHPGNLP